MVMATTVNRCELFTLAHKLVIDNETKILKHDNMLILKKNCKIVIPLVSKQDD